jgi:aspartate--ammonia ligase
MGIRVDQATLLAQLDIRKENHKKDLLFHRMLLEGKLPFTMGGGIGQSRTCMFLLQKSHIGEVQAGIWPEEIFAQCQQAGIPLL